MKKFLILWLVLTAGCVNHITQVVSVLKFQNQRPMGSIPAVYSDWYADTEACLEESGDFSDIDWFTAEEIEKDGTFSLGIIQYPNEITIKVGHERWRFVIRHEMAHHIVGPDREIHFDEGTRALCDGGLVV